MIPFCPQFLNGPFVFDLVTNKAAEATPTAAADAGSGRGETGGGGLRCRGRSRMMGMVGMPACRGWATAAGTILFSIRRPT